MARACDGVGMTSRPPQHARVIGIAVKLLILVSLGVAIHFLIEWAMAQIEKLEAEQAALAMVGMLIISLIAYALLMAIPFVPGIELGITLLILRGAEIAPFVYSATFFGLMLAFLTGRYLPLGWISSLLSDLGLTRAASLLKRLSQQSPDTHITELRANLPKPLSPVLTNARYLMLAVLLNVPGNALLGGGGGIMLAAGLSRVFTLRLTALTVALAVAPVPFLVWSIGTDFLN
jgi:hypothetical protein